MIQKLLPFALAGLLVSGCATNEPVRPGAQTPATVTSAINLSGFPPEFRRGFTDGCTVARDGGASARPPSDGQYAVGWNDGFDYCKPKKAK